MEFEQIMEFYGTHNHKNDTHVKYYDREADKLICLNFHNEYEDPDTSSLNAFIHVDDYGDELVADKPVGVFDKLATIMSAYLDEGENHSQEDRTNDHHGLYQLFDCFSNTELYAFETLLWDIVHRLQVNEPDWFEIKCAGNTWKCREGASGVYLYDNESYLVEMYDNWDRMFSALKNRKHCA